MMKLTGIQSLQVLPLFVLLAAGAAALAFAAQIPAPSDVAAAPADAETTASGLASKVLEAGSGSTHPTATSNVTVHYTGWTTDGQMFDSSVTRGQPATFPLNGVIRGWTEGVQFMVVGEKRRFWIPEEPGVRRPAGSARHARLRRRADRHPVAFRKWGLRPQAPGKPLRGPHSPAPGLPGRAVRGLRNVHIGSKVFAPRQPDAIGWQWRAGRRAARTSESSRLRSWAIESTNVKLRGVLKCAICSRA